MQVTFYKNTSDNRVVNKSLTTLKSDIIIQNQPIDRDKPIFKVGYDESLLLTNYCYIDVFQRYYYIDTVETQGQVLNVICDKCDVLMSFRDDILQCNATLERQSSRFNPYLSDEEISTSSKANYEIIEFDYEFRKNPTFIMLVNGG